MESEYDFFHSPKKEQREEKKRKEWIRAKEGVEIYSMSRPKLVRLAREAGAVYKIDGTLLINARKLEEYLEMFRIPE